MFSMPATGNGSIARGSEAEVPWSEKYRPKTLDEVAAHKDVIETSTFQITLSFSRSFAFVLRVPGVAR